jgi:hypothetical protein
MTLASGELISAATVCCQQAEVALWQALAWPCCLQPKKHAEKATWKKGREKATRFIPGRMGIAAAAQVKQQLQSLAIPAASTASLSAAADGPQLRNGHC